MSMSLPRDYAVRYSGHGSPFRPKRPVFNLSLSEATKQAEQWEILADTIGGRAEVVKDTDPIENL